MEVPIKEIRVIGRKRKVFGDLEELAKSIQRHGLMQPIGITKDRQLIFGERRLRACRDILKWKTITSRVLDFDKERMLEAEIDENIVRKNFTLMEKMDIVEHLRGYSHGGNRRGCKKGALTLNEASKMSGLGGEETFRRARFVVESGFTDLVDRIDSGEISIGAANNESRKRLSMSRYVPKGERPPQGLFYCMRPDLENLLRIKLGFTSSIDRRSKEWSTFNPTARILGTWDCKRSWEKVVIAQAITKDCNQLSEEEFDVSSVDQIKKRIDLIFEMLWE